MNTNLLKKIALPLLGGMAVGYFANRSKNSGQETREQYEDFKQPPLSPPGAVFPIVWTGLYTMMGVAHYIVSERAEGKEKEEAERTYYTQLGLNFAWTPLFFKYEQRGLALVDAGALAYTASKTAKQFGAIDERAGWLMAPYAAWTMFACYLNAGTWYLNDVQ